MKREALIASFLFTAVSSFCGHLYSPEQDAIDAAAARWYEFGCLASTLGVFWVLHLRKKSGWAYGAHSLPFIVAIILNLDDDKRWGSLLSLWLMGTAIVLLVLQCRFLLKERRAAARPEGSPKEDPWDMPH